MRISDWSSDVCSSDLAVGLLEGGFEGSILIRGEEAAKLHNDGRTRLRRDALGFVYQFHHLLPDFSAVENVILPQMIRNADPRDRKSVVSGKSVSVRVDLGGRRIIKKKTKTKIKQ